MSDMSPYLQNKMINDYLRTATVYVGLLTDESTEVSAKDYNRVKITFIEPENGQTSNDSDVLFPVSESDWGRITHMAVYNAETKGEYLFKSKADVVKEITKSGQYKIPKNYLIIRPK